MFGGSSQYERIKKALDKSKDQDEILLLQIPELETRPIWNSEDLDQNLSSDIAKLEAGFATIKLAALKVCLCFYFFVFRISILLLVPLQESFDVEEESGSKWILLVRFPPAESRPMAGRIL